MIRLSLRLFLIPLIWIIQSCSTITDDSLKDKPVWRLGFVRIDLSKDQNKAKRSDITTVGVWLDETGYGVGYSSIKSISLNDTCRFVVIVKNEIQLENIKLFFKNSGIMDGDGLCIEIE